MSEPTIRIPVTCPKCGIERLTEFPVSVVAEALLRDADITLAATCHDVAWNATDFEKEQIRQYLLAVWIDAQRGSV